MTSEDMSTSIADTTLTIESVDTLRSQKLQMSPIKNGKKKMKKQRRSHSSIEFDRLLRIKSDIQVNITKKVCKIEICLKLVF
jgi:hypothetical protein